MVMEKIKVTDLLNPNLNGFRYSSPLRKYSISCTLALLWSAVFGIMSAELIYFGYSLVGHILAISMVFVTWMLFSYERKHSHPSPPNKVQWDLEREG